MAGTLITKTLAESMMTMISWQLPCAALASVKGARIPATELQILTVIAVTGMTATKAHAEALMTMTSWQV